MTIEPASPVFWQVVPAAQALSSQQYVLHVP
jgi:hypothetical protein